ncbi:MAG: hypothetical protein Q9M36_08025 [Sulfurovum sp.]|nr:hypothetical protein [Sulfurovum sp.]
MLTDVLNLSMIFLLVLKIVDLFYKITFIRKVFVQGEVSSDMHEILAMKLSKWFFFMGVTTYPSILYMALL